MVVTTGGEKRRGVAETLPDLKSGHTRIKANRSLQVGGLQMNVANPGTWVRDVRSFPIGLIGLRRSHLSPSRAVREMTAW